MASISILMATYNGEEFIEGQIESILSQHCQDWRLIISDDGSDDRTVEILKKHASMHPQKIFLLPDDCHRLGSQKRFTKLLEVVETEYFMLCDQDDYWCPTKVGKLFSSMMNVESIYGESIPLLVHSRLKVCNSNLESISADFHSYQNLQPHNAVLLNRLVVENSVVGCSLIGNKALLEKSLPIPDEAFMHDWWLALVACCFGHIEYLRESLTHYRQHENNVMGGRHYDSMYVLRRMLDRLRGRDRLSQYFSMITNQAVAFSETYGNSLTHGQAYVLSEFCSIEAQGYLRRIYIKLKNGFHLSGLMRNVGYLLFF